MSSRLEELLLRSGAVDEEALHEARRHVRGRDTGVGRALVELGRLDEETLARNEAKLAGMPFVDLENGDVQQAVLERMPRELALQHQVVPVLERGTKLFIAIDDPLRRIVTDALGFLFDCELDVALATPTGLARALERYYGAGGAASTEANGSEGAGAEDDAPIVRLVDRTFADALARRASDIHLEPKADQLRVRYRIDGRLRTAASHPAHLAAPLLSRLKGMGRMDIAERRKPQDGRIDVEVDGRTVDVRASILPTNHGETMVLRLLDRSAELIRLRQLGFEEEEEAWFTRLIQRPHGIVLVTGPTGSGKTTTLYAALAERNRPDVKILTAEDPVEYRLPGINQMQVNPKIDLSFARILRSMLRAAPNIILVGEIRDRETAEVAIQAALTGHLVFSTLHTNDAPSAITRLFDMGVPPFLVSGSLQGVVSQRLVRRLCDCAEPYEPGTEELSLLGPQAESGGGERAYRRPRGCERCDQSGFHGRVGLFERLSLDGELRDAVFRGEGLETLRATASSAGRLHTLLASGARKARAGVTSIGEVLRAVGLEAAWRRAIASSEEDPLS